MGTQEPSDPPTVEQAEATLQALNLSHKSTSSSSEIFSAPSQWQPQGRIFGGQVLAQSILAAGRSVPENRGLHSLHAYFLRPGDMNEELHLEVNRLRDGQSFSARRVEVVQQNGTIFSMIASFQAKEQGLQHQIAMPDGITPPSALQSDVSRGRRVAHQLSRDQILNRPFEIRHVEAPIYDSVEGPDSARQSLWFRFPLDVGDDPILNQALIAYASDMTLLEPTLRRHRVQWSTPGLMVASIDHAMWFYRHASAHEWLLYHQTSPSAQGARGLSTAHIFASSGALVATVVQEGLFRIPPGSLPN